MKLREGLCNVHAIFFLQASLKLKSLKGRLYQVAPTEQQGVTHMYVSSLFFTTSIDKQAAVKFVLVKVLKRASTVTDSSETF